MDQMLMTIRVNYQANGETKYSFTPSFNKYLPGVYYVPGYSRHGDTTNKMNPCPRGTLRQSTGKRKPTYKNADN